MIYYIKYAYNNMYKYEYICRVVNIHLMFFSCCVRSFCVYRAQLLANFIILNCKKTQYKKKTNS